MVAGGHTTERVRPFLVTRAMHWLAQIAAQEAARSASDSSRAERQLSAPHVARSF